MTKIFIKLILLISSIFFLSGCCEQYVSYSEKSKFVDNETYIKVNGHKMHYLKKGKKIPTVVFESGLDFSGYLSWFKVQDKVSKFATTLSYDRAGILRSEKSTLAKTCENTAEDLHTLLEKVDAQKPFILVAHSLGGLYARCFVKKYPNYFDGIILVDASHPLQMEKAPKDIKDKMSPPIPSDWLFQLMLKTGIAKLYTNNLLDTLLEKNNQKEKIKQEINLHYEHTMNGVLTEFKIVDQLANDAKGATFGSIPLIVLSASKYNDEEEKKIVDYMYMLQKDSLNLSINSKLIKVDSTHLIPLEKPEVVIDAIKEMIQKINEK